MNDCSHFCRLDTGFSLIRRYLEDLKNKVKGTVPNFLISRFLLLFLRLTVTQSRRACDTLPKLNARHLTVCCQLIVARVYSKGENKRILCYFDCFVLLPVNRFRQGHAGARFADGQTY